MKRKLLSILALLCLTVSSAWAQEEQEQEKYLYLEIEEDGMSATLMYGEFNPSSGKPYYDGSEWLDENYSYMDILDLTVDESCLDFEGESLLYLFNGWMSLSTITDIENLNTANVKDMTGMFDGCSGLSELDLSSWNTSNVETMESMFHGCDNLTSLNLSSWNTSNVTNMSGMFSDCNELEDLDLSGWNTSNVETMESMFSLCTTLSELDLSSWNTSNVTDMSGMFMGNSSLSELNLSGWNTYNVTTMSYMFDDCSELETIYVGPGWSTKAVTESTDMFKDCDCLLDEDEDKIYINYEGGYLTLSDCNVTAKKVGNSYWSTFYTTAGNYQAEVGTQVFIVALNGTTLTLTEIEDGIINSGQAVVLKSETESIELSAKEEKSESDYTGNSLQGTMGNITKTKYPNIYVLNYKAATGVGFYRLSEGGTISANKAYLESSEDAREFFSFDETTAIEAIDNGQLAIDDVVYDLQGRRISQPTKGLYIVNGKKVFINK